MFINLYETGITVESKETVKDRQSLWTEGAKPLGGELLHWKQEGTLL